MAEVSRRLTQLDGPAYDGEDIGHIRDALTVSEKIPMSAPKSPQVKEAEPEPEPEPTPEAPAEKPANPALADRMARFKALQAAKEQGKKANTEAWRKEEGRKGQDPAEAERLKRIHDRAEVKLVKAEDGDQHWRKRAWDQTVDEVESWDKRTKKKKGNVDSNAFQDYRAEANKVYKRQISQMSKAQKDALEQYELQKAETLQRQVQSGVLTLVENDNGDVYTIDANGFINTPAEENYNCDHKPTKEAVDRLVEDLEKGERARLKARAKRGREAEDDAGDVTYINAKNKQFNDKLARFYNRYTSEIRDNFERGTAI